MDTHYKHLENRISNLETTLNLLVEYYGLKVVEIPEVPAVPARKEITEAAKKKR